MPTRQRQRTAPSPARTPPTARERFEAAERLCPGPGVYARTDTGERYRLVGPALERGTMRAMVVYRTEGEGWVVWAEPAEGWAERHVRVE